VESNCLYEYQSIKQERFELVTIKKLEKNNLFIAYRSRKLSGYDEKLSMISPALATKRKNNLPNILLLAYSKCILQDKDGEAVFFKDFNCQRSVFSQSLKALILKLQYQ
jgi:hypothetical protein